MTTRGMHRHVLLAVYAKAASGRRHRVGRSAESGRVDVALSRAERRRLILIDCSRRNVTCALYGGVGVEQGALCTRSGQRVGEFATMRGTKAHTGARKQEAASVAGILERASRLLAALHRSVCVLSASRDKSRIGKSTRIFSDAELNDDHSLDCAPAAHAPHTVQPGRLLQFAMNSLYTLALRQSSSLSSDLQHLASLSAADQMPSTASPLYTQIQQGFSQLDRTVDDYEDMARREIVEQKRDKALARVNRFRQDYRDLKAEYERIKQHQKTATERSELLGGSSSASGTSAAPSSSSTYRTNAAASSRFDAGQPSNGTSASGLSTPQPRYTPNSPWVPSPSAYPSSGGANDYTSNMFQAQDRRTDAALREHDFLGQTGQTLDAYLAQGQAVLGNLASQRDVLKGTYPPRAVLRLETRTSRLTGSTITPPQVHGGESSAQPTPSASLARPSPSSSGGPRKTTTSSSAAELSRSCASTLS